MKFLHGWNQPEKVEFWFSGLITLLIGVEVYLSIISIGGANRQIELMAGLEQQSVYQAEKLRQLASSQEKSLASLVKMNEALQTSVNATRSMNEAMKRQLAILEIEQKQRLAELARVPKIEATLGGVPIKAGAGVAVPGRELTATDATLEMVLVNTGSATLKGGVLKVLVDAAAVELLSTNANWQKISLPEQIAKAASLIEVRIDKLSPAARTVILVHAKYPADTGPFLLTFGLEAENLARTELGSVIITPPRK